MTSVIVYVIRDGLARLADAAPTEIVVPTEETDWGLIGADFRDAMVTIDGEIAPHVPSEDHDELVEA